MRRAGWNAADIIIIGLFIVVAIVMAYVIIRLGHTLSQPVVGHDPAGSVP